MQVNNQIKDIKYRNAVLSLCDKYRCFKLHAETVKRTGVTIFNLLKDLHNLSENELELLCHAALLHDIGQYISEKKHHKHSAYLILNDEELYDYPQNEKKLLAELVKGHRKSVKLSSSDFSKSEHSMLQKLIAILRIADALDYLHNGKVEVREVQRDKFSCTFYVKDAGLEVIYEKVKKKAAYFEEVFDLKTHFVSVKG